MEEIITGLQTLAVREDAVRLGGPDSSFREDYENFLRLRLLPVLQEPATDSDQQILFLTKLLELMRPSSDELTASTRLSVIEALGGMTLTFEAGPTALARHISVCNVLWAAIETEREKNGLAAVKTFQSLYRNCHVVMDAELSTRLHRFVQWLRGMFANIPRLVDEGKSGLACEAPSIIHLLVQVFSGAAESYLTPLLGDLVNLLQVPNENMQECQVKILTFIAYISRSSRSEALRSQDASIARACVRLLRAVPCNANITTRRELLLNLRSCFHSPDLCVAFVPQIDDLFDESVVVGVGRSSYDLLRPIVISALADFTNGIKDKIPVERVRKILGFFTSAMADSDLPVNSQYTSARIVLNLIDQVFNKSANRARKLGGTVQDGSDILREVMRAIAEKFTALVLFVPKVISLVSEGLGVYLPSSAPKIAIDQAEMLTRLVGRGSTPSGVPLADLLVEGVREVRSLIRTLLLSAKMIVHCLTHRVTARMLTKNDLGVLDSLLEDGLKVSHLFACAAGYVQSAGFDMSTGHSSANGGGRFGSASELAVACSIQEERELIEQLAGVLVVVPQTSLTDLLAKKILWLVDAIQANSQLMALCNALIQTPSSMAVLCEVMYGLLAVRGEDILIGGSEKHQIRFGVVDRGIDGSGQPLATQDNTLLGPISNTLYFFSHNEATDAGLLVSHVMPSLDPKFRDYKSLVACYQLRDSPVRIDGRDVLLTIGKTLARQVMSGGNNAVALEPVVRPFANSIVVSCLRVAKHYPASSAYCAGTLRYMFRLMGSGSKTSGTVRELADLVSVIVDQCRLLAVHWKSNPSLHALWLEVAITVPVRLKSLVANFESMMAVLVEALSVENFSETVAVALSVLESWVDGLTPDFLFPLIPGHSDRSLVQVLLSLTSPVKGQTVHSTAGGNNAVRAARILGKLGVKAKFATESYNVIGETPEGVVGDMETKFLVQVANTVVEIDLDKTLKAALYMLKSKCVMIELLPVSLQDPPVDTHEVSVQPVQELLDALNLVVTAIASHRSQDVVNEQVLSVLYRGLMHAAGCSVEIVAEKAKSIISDLATEVSEVLIAAVDETRAGVLAPVCSEVISSYIDNYQLAGTRQQTCPPELVLIVNRLAEKLLSHDWTEVYGAATGLVAVASSSKAYVVLSELAEVVISRALLAGLEAEGTRTRAPSVQVQRVLSELVVAVVKVLVGNVAGPGKDAPQETQIQFLSKQKILSPLQRLVEIALENFSSRNACNLSESVLFVVSELLGVSVGALVCWVDPVLEVLRAGIAGDRSGPVFRLTSFVLQLRPSPVLPDPLAGERLHKALISAIHKAVDWIEKGDELRVVNDPSAAGGVHQRAVMKRNLMGSCDVEGHVTRWVEAVRLLKLTLLHPQLNAGMMASATPVAGTGTDWTLAERIAVILARSLFSFDYETVQACIYTLNVCRLTFSIDSRVWQNALLPLAREIVMRLPSSLVEVQGLGRLLQFIPASAEEIKAELADRLFERLHTYLSALRERTFTPAQSSWRSQVGQDSIVGLTAVTLECFGSLQTERLPLIERLLQMVSQLDAALPCTFGAGQLSSPFLQPLVSCLCSDPERTADQLLTKMELHKVFPLVAELVSLRSCLGLRKSLQDKCHQMSLMDTGVLMMRTAAASLISVLARSDSSYLWLQYCSVLMKASMGLPRSLSLIESLVRNWETNLAALTGAAGRPPVLALSPGGIMGPSDTSNSVNSYEGRIIAWSVMQFLRAPIIASPGVVADIEQHLNIRVRFLIRLATSLSLKNAIEISPVQDWFLTEASSLTTASEKREIVTKTVEAFTDGAVGLGCKYALLRYLVIPQLTSETVDEELAGRMVSALFNPSTYAGEMEEAVRVELLRLLVVILESDNAGHFVHYSQDLLGFVHSCVRTPGVAVKQAASLALSRGIEARVFDPNSVGTQTVASEIVMAMFDSSQSDFWRKCLSESSGVISRFLSDNVVRERVKERLTQDTGADVSVWKWFLCISAGLDESFLPSVIHLFSKRHTFASTDARVTALEVALVALNWVSRDPLSVLGGFFVRHAVNGPEPHSPGSPGQVSPTLWSEFMDKCLEGLRRCCQAGAWKLDMSDFKIPSLPNPNSQAEVVRHCKQLVSLGRMLIEYIRLSGVVGDVGHISHFLGLCIVSTDKSVVAVAALLISTIVRVIDMSVGPNELVAESAGQAHTVARQICLGIQSGLKTGGGHKLKVHAMNPHSPAYPVTVYSAAACLIGVLRGLAFTGNVAGIKSWLTWAQPLLVKTVSHSARVLVLALLPSQLHQYALAGTRTSPPKSEGGGMNSQAGFVYPGVLQGAEFSFPSLLELVRLSHLSDIVGPRSQQFRDSVVWLVECLGPFVSLASPNHQTFANLLVGLNLASPSAAGAPAVSVIQLSALVRHCIGIVGRWCLGPQYSVRDSWEDTWILDSVVADHEMESEEKKSLVLSLSSSLIGKEVLLACCDVSPVVTALGISSIGQKPVADEAVVTMYRAVDGISILSSIADESIKKLFGFVPSRAVTCFPGSLVDKGLGLKSGPGGLFAIASELVLDVLGALGSKLPPSMLPCVLLGCSSMDASIRAQFVRYLRLMVPPASEPAARLSFLLKECPWQFVSGRMFLGVMVEVLLAGGDDRVAGGLTAEFEWIDSALGMTWAVSKHSIFTSVFSQLVDSVPTDLRSSIYSQIVLFLEKLFLEKQSWFHPNVVGALLASCPCSLPPSLLIHCAGKHGLWFESLAILDSMTGAGVEQSNAVSTILKSLGDKDSVLALDSENKQASALMAQSQFEAARPLVVHQPDLWIESCKALSDWGSLAEVKQQLTPSVQLEVACMTQDWGSVAELLSQFDWGDDPKAKLLAGYLGLSFAETDLGTQKQRSFLSDLEASVSRTLQQIVSRWNLIPSVGSQLLMAQQLVELGEAAVLISDIRAAVMGLRPTYPNPKQLLSAWRDRVPDKFAESSGWFEILNLRSVVFRQIQQLCAVDVVASSHIAPFLHDLPWALVRIAKHVPDKILAQQYLNRFQQSLTRASTETFNQELFEALKEQIKLYGDETEEQLRTALNVLNSCAISQTNSQQAAEISWMQGRLLRKLGLKEESKKALLFAVNTYPMIAKAWIETGDLMWENGELGEECQMAYMLGLALRPSRASRIVPRLLLLARSGCTSLAEKCKDSQPSSVWIFWVNTLVHLLKDEAVKETAKALLAKVSLTFPQSVYWQLSTLGTAQDQELQASVAEIMREMRNEKTGPLMADLEGCRSGLLAVADRWVQPVRHITQAEKCLEDIRFRRASHAEIKQRLPKNVEPSEVGIMKFLKSERKTLPAVSEEFLGTRWPMTGLVEVPGTYTRHLSVASGSSMESMGFVRIAAVDNRVDTSIVGKPVVAFIGTNGLRYRFSVQTGSSDGLGLQMTALVNELLSKSAQTKQRGVKIECLQSLPLGPGLMIQEAPMRVKSWERVFQESTDEVDCVDESVAEFKRLVDSLGSRNPERAAFDQFEFPDSLLVGCVNPNGPEQLYAAAKKFTTSLATLGMVDHVLGFAATDRSLSELMLSKEGSVFVTDETAGRMRKHSHVDVPFRLTRNAMALIGDRNAAGLLPACMRAVIDCLHKKQAGLIDMIQLMEGETEKFNQRIEEIAEADGYLYQKIEKMITESRDAKNLANVQPRQWLPWM